MDQSSAELYAQAMKLSADDRAELAALLLESLDDGADEDVDEAWREAIERRMQEMDNGTVTPVSWEQGRARLLKHGAA
jgi:putative addiction module component (TIGR02574 family)